jgi:hypothetical protein
MAQFTTGYNSIPVKPTVSSSITKGIANHFGREYTLKNVDNFQKTLLKYIDKNEWEKTFKLKIWTLHNDKLPEDWKTLINMTLVEIEVPPPLGKGNHSNVFPEGDEETKARRVKNLKWCIKNGYNKMAKYMINKVYSQDYSDNVPLQLNVNNIIFIAIENDNKEVITELLNNGANPNIKQEITGKTPLLMAIEKHNVELVKELLTHDADPNIKQERTGKTLLMLAIEMRNVELVKELLSHDADPNIKDDNDRSAVDTAKDTEHKEIIRLLTPFSTVAKEVRQDMRKNGIPINEDNNKVLSVVALPDLSREISEYLGEGGKRKKTNKKRKLREKTVKRKTKKNNKKNINKK